MRKLCFFSFSFALAVFACQYFLEPNWELAAAGGALALMAVAAISVRGARRLGAVIAAAGVAAGCLYNFGYDRLIFSSALELDGVTEEFTAKVADFPVATDYGSYVDIRIDADRGPDLKARAYVFDDAADKLRPGDVIRMTADLGRADRVGEREITGYTSKGYMLFASDGREIELVSSDGVTVTNFHRYLAKAIRDRIDEIFPLGTGDFMRALLTGDRTGLNEDVELDSAMERAGVSHIVAVSGLHVSILAGCLLTVLGRRRWAVMATVPVLLLFMAVSGFSPSVVRAVVMQLFVLTAPLIMRESDSLTSLAAALLLLLLINPYAVTGVGMQLSFLATLGIIVFTPRINGFLTKGVKKGKKLLSRAVRWVAGTLSATLGALLLTTPVSAYYFGCVSIIAPVTNILVLWAVTPAFFLGALAVGVGFVYLPAGAAVAYAPAVLVRYIMWVVKLLAKPFLAAVYLDGTAAVAWFTVTYLSVVLIAALRLGAIWLLRVGCLSATALCVMFVWKDVALSAGGGYTMTVLDVGQGQGIVVTAGDHMAVIDCGSMSGENAGRIAERYIRAMGRDRVDVLILTHYHTDHANGAERLIADLDVDTLILPEPRFAESDLDEEVIAAGERAGCGVIYVTDKLTVALGDTSVTVYPPLGEETENERGLMMTLEHDRFETLITGDAPGYLELQFIDRYDVGDIECMVVGHHGSAGSTTEELLDAVTPEVAVISVGENSYGHPTEAVLERLRERDIQILRTDESGNIKIRSR